MRSYLILNTPWQGTGNRSEWSFSGADDLALRECLARLDELVASDAADRGTAAIVLGFSDQGPRKPEGAWTIDGALALTEILPETLGDLRNALLNSFSARKAGWLGDAHTPPTNKS